MAVGEMTDLDMLARMAVGLGALQKQKELSGLIGLVSELHPLRVLEIGTRHGQTLMCWCRLAHPYATIVSVDLPDGPYGGGYPPDAGQVFGAYVQGQQDLTLIPADSHAPRTLQLVEGKFPASNIDFLFIDGDHSYDGVMNDYEMYGPLVRKGGLIAFHDIADHAPEMSCHVREAWLDIVSAGDFTEKWEFLDPTPDSNGNDWGGLGALRV